MSRLCEQLIYELHSNWEGGFAVIRYSATHTGRVRAESAGNNGSVIKGFASN